MVDLGLLVKSHRKKAGLTQLELANLAGIGKTTVFDIKIRRLFVGATFLPCSRY